MDVRRIAPGGIELRYGCDTRRLPAELAACFVELDADDSTRAWIERAIAEPQPRAVTALRDLARTMVDIYDANGLVGAYSMRVLGTAQWRRLLGDGSGRVLDVGAGDGEVTAELAPLFDEVITTELSAPMARRLRKRGFVCHEVDLAVADLPGREAPFDLVALLNVLDRTTNPLSLLERLPSLLAPGGRAVIAVPLPLSPVAFAGPRACDPEEPLPEGGGDWESDVTALWSRAIAPQGLGPLALTRVPYLCRGDARRPVEVLDDAVLVLGAPGG